MTEASGLSRQRQQPHRNLFRELCPQRHGCGQRDYERAAAWCDPRDRATTVHYVMERQEVGPDEPVTPRTIMANAALQYRSPPGGHRHDLDDDSMNRDDCAERRHCRGAGDGGCSPAAAAT